MLQLVKNTHTSKSRGRFAKADGQILSSLSLSNMVLGLREAEMEEKKENYVGKCL